MEEILTNWAALIGYFLVTGGVYEATKRTVRAKAGDPGFKGFYYVWGRILLLPLGVLLAIGGHYTGVPLHSAFGEELGGAILAGSIASAVAGFAYTQVIGIAKTRIKHKVEKAGK